VADNPIAVAYLEQERALELGDIDELDALQRDLSERPEAAPPLVISFEARGYCIYLGLDGDLAFVQVTRVPAFPPYIITVGDLDAEWSTDFFLHGEHHTEISDRHLVPVAQAWRAVRELILTGQFIYEVGWEEI
jgi:hypothetical protein